MSVESARAHLAQFGKEDAILFFQESSATVELAAHALHTQPGRIAKTLSFLTEDGPILIVCAGDARIDNRRYKDLSRWRNSPPIRWAASVLLGCRRM